MSRPNWRDRITPEQCDWEYLTEWHLDAASIAARKVAAQMHDPMCDYDDYYQDAVLLLAANPDRMKARIKKGLLVDDLVNWVMANNRAGEDRSAEIDYNKSDTLEEVA